MASLGPEHVARVRLLYKTILRMHRGMPTPLRALGDQYVKDEFRRHKNCEVAFVPEFMMQWSEYAVHMGKELRKKPDKQEYGGILTEDKLNLFSDEQLGQLHELYKEASKPIDPNNPLGENPNVKQEPPS